MPTWSKLILSLFFISMGKMHREKQPDIKVENEATPTLLKNLTPEVPGKQRTLAKNINAPSKNNDIMT